MIATVSASVDPKQNIITTAAQKNNIAIDLLIPPSNPYNPCGLTRLQ